MQRSLTCVADAVALAQGYHPALEPLALVVNRARPIPLSGGSLALSIVVQQQYTFHEDRSAAVAQRWRMHGAGYWYYLLDRAAERELLAFHWHPGIEERRHAITVVRPHLHLRSGLLAPLTSAFAKSHLPTGLVTLEDFLWFLITQLSVRPHRPDWERILSRAETRDAFAHV